MTDELRGYFYDLATVEQGYVATSPGTETAMYRPWISACASETHPALAITSRLKMQNAVPAQVSYSGKEVRQSYFGAKMKTG